MTQQMFPILLHWSHARRSEWERLGCPSEVPWSFVEQHEQQALRNHSQTLHRLAERGGLSPCEMVAVVEDREWESMSDAAAIERLRDLLARHLCTP